MLQAARWWRFLLATGLVPILPTRSLHMSLHWCCFSSGVFTTTWGYWQLWNQVEYHTVHVWGNNHTAQFHYGLRDEVLTAKNIARVHLFLESPQHLYSSGRQTVLYPFLPDLAHCVIEHRLSIMWQSCDSYLPPWWCDRLPPLAIISSRALACEWKVILTHSLPLSPYFDVLHCSNGVTDWEVIDG